LWKKMKEQLNDVDTNKNVYKVQLFKNKCVFYHLRLISFMLYVIKNKYIQYELLYKIYVIIK